MFKHCLIRLIVVYTWLPPQRRLCITMRLSIFCFFFVCQRDKLKSLWRILTIFVERCCVWWRELIGCWCWSGSLYTLRISIGLASTLGSCSLALIFALNASSIVYIYMFQLLFCALWLLQHDARLTMLLTKSTYLFTYLLT